MKPYIIISLSIILANSPLQLLSQGCSDAGVCTIQSIKTNEPYDSSAITHNTLDAGFSFGLSQYEVVVLTPFIEYTRNMGKKVSVTGRFSAGYRSGELANLFDISDVTISSSYAFVRRMKLVGGVKLPLNNGNLKKNGMPLPMNYQSSLGTYDLILGLSYTLKRFSFIAGFQQPLTQNNNSFQASNYPVDAPENKYYSTNGYHRYSDALLRISYYPVDNKKLRLATSLLPIFHTQNDRYTDSTGNTVIIEQSQGLTLNITAILQYKIKKDRILEFTAGAPAIARKVRPDGLSKFGIGIEYKYLF